MKTQEAVQLKWVGLSIADKSLEVFREDADAVVWIRLTPDDFLGVVVIRLSFINDRQECWFPLSVGSNGLGFVVQGIADTGTVIVSSCRV